MSLRERLSEEKEKAGFISVKVLEHLITPTSVQQLLGLSPEPTGGDFERALAKSLPRARKLLAVLVLAELESYIPLIITQGITDDIFPIESLQTIPPLDSKEEAMLFKEQWSIPPVLQSEKHLQLPEGALLPFLQKKLVDSGSFGIVYRVKLAKGHLDSRWSGQSEVCR